MKKTLLLCFFAGMAMAAVAQDNTRYEKAMKENVSKLDTLLSNPALEELANNFERIAAVKTDQWLPLYYASLCQIRLAFQQQDKTKIDPIVDEAEKNADRADALQPDKSEMLCLRSLIAAARIMVDPQTRGAQYGPQATTLLAQAKAAAPGNPRIYLLLGENAFYTPAQWGGGKDKAKPLLAEALDKYGSFTPASDIAPNWGKPMAAYLLSQCDQ